MIIGQLAGNWESFDLRCIIPVNEYGFQKKQEKPETKN